MTERQKRNAAEKRGQAMGLTTDAAYPSEKEINTRIAYAIQLLTYAEKWTPSKGKVARLRAAIESAESAIGVQ